MNIDGRAEVIFTSWPKKASGKRGHLHILDYHGAELYRVGLPATANGGTWNGALGAPTIANIDADADLELVVGTVASGVVAYKLPNTSNARVLWGTGRGDVNRTGTAATATLTPPPDTTSPTVTINQAATQADPTSSAPILFTAVFSEPVSGFTGSDVAIGGTAGGTKTVSVSGGPSTYTVAVSDMTTDGTVIATIPAGRATDAAGNPNTASTSTDNSVTFAVAGETVTRIEETSTAIVYAGTWAQGNTDRAWSGGTAAVSTEALARATLSFTGTGVSWIGFRGPQAGIARVFRDGTLVATVDAFASAEEVGAVLYTASGLTDAAHTLAIEVTGEQNPAGIPDTGFIVVDAFDVTSSTGSPDTTAPSVTINQAAAQADPTSASPILFTAVFSEAVSGFTGSDVAIGGTAGGTKTVSVSGGPSTYTVAVSGMTTDGTVIATIPAGAASDAAGNPNTASTSTDNTVTFTADVAVSPTPPTITGFSPASGPVAIVVIISGSNFTGATAVRFNGVNAIFTVTTATSISATVPSGATTGLISVTTPGGTATSSSTFTVTLPPPPSTILWSADHEEGNMSDWYVNSGGGEFNSGNAVSQASRDVAHTGSWSAKGTITTDSSFSAVRLFRWNESRANPSAYYSAWYYFPQKITSSAWGNNVFQFKSKRDLVNSDPFWDLLVRLRSNGNMYLTLSWWCGLTVEGPHVGESGCRTYQQTLKDLPVGQWVHIETFLRQSSAFDGQIVVWQDGVEIFNQNNVKTRYPNNGGWGPNDWSINNYGENILPSPFTIYFDDAAISTARLGPG